jgi:hypothetical protein
MRKQLFAKYRFKVGYALRLTNSTVKDERFFLIKFEEAHLFVVVVGYV